MNVDDAIEKLIVIICNSICATGESGGINTGDDNTKISDLLAISHTRLDHHLCDHHFLIRSDALVPGSFSSFSYKPS